MSELKAFVQMCKDNPSVLHLPEMGFFKSWLYGSVLVCVVYGIAFSTDSKCYDCALCNVGFYVKV